MQVSCANDVKIYNLSAGKSLPEWIEEKRRRKLGQKDGDTRRRIQLLQDFDMPIVSNKVEISKDGQFVLAIGTYKPRMKCFEVNQLGMKFERCFDSEAVAMSVLSDDYSKILFLHCDRYVNIHAQGGHYYKLRIPNFGRDMAYHTSTCDVYFAGDGSRVSRLNLEQGRFLNPYQMDSTASNVIEMNKEHQLVSIGTTDGKVEAWDPRSRQRVGILDCVADMGCKEQDGIPEITALAFRDALNMGVGTSTGKVLLYDIRSSKAILTKDHLYDLPIKKVVFHSTLDQVLSMDGKVVKIWDRQTGKAYASIESDHDMNDLAVYPGSGLMFMANEQPKLQVHYIPSLGPAPRWCSFLDNLTEELEESAVTEVYDDYKFVTKEQIDDLGLDHLIGSSLLRAYMHGYFMDARLYRKAQGLVEPFNAEKFKEDKIKKKLEEKQEKRVQLTPKNKLPKVNKDLFIKLKDREANPIQKKKKGKADDASAKLLEDDRFKDMFSDDRFAVDTNEEAYKLLNPVLSRLDEKTKKKYEAQEVEKSDEDSASEMSEDPVDSDIESHDESSSEEEEVVQRKDKKKKPLTTDKKTVSLPQPSGEIGFYELKEGVSATGAIDRKLAKKNKASLESRIRDAEESGPVIRRDGVMSMTFKSKKSKTQIKEALANKKHIQERIAVRRSVGMLKNKNKKDYS